MGSVTPGDLVKAALNILGLWVLYALGAVVLDFPDALTANWIAWVVWLPVITLLVIAGIAKAVQIGMNTSRKD